MLATQTTAASLRPERFSTCTLPSNQIEQLGPSPAPFTSLPLSPYSTIWAHPFPTPFQSRQGTRTGKGSTGGGRPGPLRRSAPHEAIKSNLSIVIAGERRSNQLYIPAMEQSLSELPEDVESLRAIIAAQAEELARQNQRLRSRDTLIEKLKAQLAVLRRARFGASSEKIERSIEQLELALEDIEAADAEVEVSARSAGSREKAKPSRQPLPDHLPRQEIVHQAACACPDCGGSPSSATARTSPRCSSTFRRRSASSATSGRATPASDCDAAGASDDADRCRSSAASPGAGLVAHVLCRQILRPSSALSPVRHLRSRRRRDLPFDHGRLGRHAPRALIDAARRRRYAPTSFAGEPPARRRHPGSGARPRPGRTQTGRAASGVYVRDGRPSADAKTPPAASYSLQSRSQGCASASPPDRLLRACLHADGYRRVPRSSIDARSARRRRRQC